MLLKKVIKLFYNHFICVIIECYLSRKNITPLKKIIILIRIKVCWCKIEKLVQVKFFVIQIIVRFCVVCDMWLSKFIIICCISSYDILLENFKFSSFFFDTLVFFPFRSRVFLIHMQHWIYYIIFCKFCCFVNPTLTEISNVFMRQTQKQPMNFSLHSLRYWRYSLVKL